MQSIPLINMVAVLHLYLIGGLLTCGMIEVVFEYYALFFKKEFHPCAIRIHHWVDVFVEIPMLIATIVSGVTMAFLVEEFTPLHYVKIGCVICLTVGYFVCFRATFYRTRQLDENASEQILIGLTKKMMVRNAIVIGIFTGLTFGCGIWLAYHRILESIYG